MRKKIFGVLAILAVLLAVSTCFGQTPVTFNLSMTVDKYLETAPGPIAWNFGTTVHRANAESLNTAAGEGSGWGEWDLAYANCPFTVTVSGDNPAGQGKPRFARAEVGTRASGFDVLSTAYQIGFLVNGDWNNQLGLNYGVRAGEFPQTATLAEAPHNGQVHMKMAAKVNDPNGPTEAPGIPIRQTLINPAFTWQQSADAGVYTATMVVTLAAF